MNLSIKFSDNKAKIENLLSVNSEFKEIYEDYESCCKTLSYLQLDPHKRMNRINEYKTIIKDLEEEVLEFLNKDFPL